MKLVNKKIFKLLFSFVCLMLFQTISYADSTYKVGEKILFGRNYEFQKSVNGTAKITGAVNDIIEIGSPSSDKFVDNIIIKADFTPSKIGVYKINIDIDAKTSGGVAVKRTDTIYFLVTENGEDMESEELQSKILDNLSGKDREDYLGYQNKPWLKLIKVSNAKIVENIDPERTEYTLVIDKNAQKIKFELTPNNEDDIIEGTLELNPNFQFVNILVLKNGDLSNTYTFKWEKPEIASFKYNDNGVEKELYYSFNDEKKYDGLDIVEHEIKGNKYKVFVDKSGNMLIPLSSGLNEDSNLYTFTTEGNILYKFDKFVNVDGQIYASTQFKKIFNEDLRLFNLEEVNITTLNGIQGYKINRLGYEGKYMVRLIKPDSLQSWYLFDINSRTLEKMNLPENIFEKQLADFFGVELEHDYKKFNYSYYDIGLMIIAFTSFIVLVVLSVLENKKNKKI